MKKSEEIRDVRTSGMYRVAENAFSVAVTGRLEAWENIRSRFAPFAVGSADDPVLDVDISVGALPRCDAERIYEPERNEVGFIAARASRTADGSLVIEFKHMAQSKRRVWMKMPSELDRAEIVFDPDGDDKDGPYFLSHALMIAFMLSTIHTGTLLMHASSVVYGGKAYLFQGKSGTGKSTHASLWTRHIPGVELLNDDNPLVRFAADGIAMAYGSPWSGKTHCYRNEVAPVGAFVRIVRATDNTLHRLAPLQAYASLTTSVFYAPFLDEKLRDLRHRTIERLVESVTCCEMHCRPDADAAMTCMLGLTRP